MLGEFLLPTALGLSYLHLRGLLHGTDFEALTVLASLPPHTHERTSKCSQEIDLKDEFKADEIKR